MAAVLLLATVTIGIVVAAYLRASRPPDRTTGRTAAQRAEEQRQQDLKLLVTTYARVQDERDRLESFVETIRKFVDRHPDFAAGRTLLGQVLLDAGKPREALEEVRTSLDLNSRQPQIHCLAGVVAAKLDDPELAEEHFLAAIALEPRNGQFRMQLANVYVHSGRLSEAKQAFGEALRLDSSLHEAHATLSGMYAEEGEPKKAIEHIRKAIELTTLSERGKHVVYVRKQARLELAADRPDDALRTLKSLTVRELLDPEVMADMTACWASKDRPDLAAELYEDAMRIFPADPNLIANAARWRITAGDTRAAREHVRALQRLSRDLPAIAELERKLRTAEGGAAGGDKR